MRFALTLVLLCLLLAGVVLGVGALTSSGGETDGGRLAVVATTPHVADLVRGVAGDRVALRRLLPPNAEPHDHEVRPGDVRAISRAGIVVASGGDVDAWLDEAVRGAGGDARRLTLIDHVDRLGDDPHWWQDPRNAVRALDAIRAELERLDPDGADAYDAGFDRSAQRIRALDAAIEDCWSGRPERQRTLVTTHDAYGYYARRYGLTVLGSVLASRSTHAQASAGEATRLAERIRKAGVRAIFVERALDPDLEEAIARQAGARVGRPLWGDTLGPAGSDGDTYLKALAADTRALVDGLTGERGACTL